MAQLTRCTGHGVVFLVMLYSSTENLLEYKSGKLAQAEFLIQRMGDFYSYFNATTPDFLILL